jgi:hypothetical protein
MSDPRHDDREDASPLPTHRRRRWLLIAAVVAVAVLVALTVVLLVWEPWVPQDLPEAPRPGAG